MESRLNAYDAAFDAPADSDDESAAFAPVHYLEDQTQDPATLIETENTSNTQSDHLQLALAQLDARSRDIVSSRWLAESKTTLHNLAARYDVSAERIRQLEVNAMKKLKAAMVA
jgi:RNA polymerase sigma-32 factor